MKDLKCPVELLFKLIGQRWSAYILWLLQVQGPIRFGEIKRMIPGISQKVLTEKLRELERAKLINRDYKPTIPPTVIYSVTSHSEELGSILKDLSVLAYTWREKGLL
jgi:DNA-binding HxlR family transcriptional regulator